ncbi:MAG: hypothetical protein Q8S53_15445 [Brevundimonas sp.]|uniref:GTA-gp10 family protein n=1 Tax=Brevundimonas sp. TaxID=1871086 RepID=UPI0027373BB6|nr:GTA-gp10 family protein [Brevundimonas sp.]MDP3379759.1 hypothetical protein [Brevundimonas sp.]
MGTLKGEVTINTAEDSYTLVYSVNAIIALEEKTGLPITRIGEFLGGDAFSFANARTFFWAGLIEHHDLSETEAGSLMSEVGIEEAMTRAADALKASLPQEAAKGNARPRKAPGGIGKTS